MPSGSFSSIWQALQHKITFENKRQREIISAANKGLEFFTRFNESRLDLAFSSFSEPMKHALFEVIYFLHVNVPSNANHEFTAQRKGRFNGVLKTIP